MRYNKMKAQEGRDIIKEGPSSPTNTPNNTHFSDLDPSLIGKFVAC